MSLSPNEMNENSSWFAVVGMVKGWGGADHVLAEGA